MGCCHFISKYVPFSSSSWYISWIQGLCKKPLPPLLLCVHSPSWRNILPGFRGISWSNHFSTFPWSWLLVSQVCWYRVIWQGLFWCSVCLMYQTWYLVTFCLFLTLRSLVISLSLQMLLLSFYLAHILYLHSLNLVYSCVTIISAQFRPISW